MGCTRYTEDDDLESLDFVCAKCENIIEQNEKSIKNRIEPPISARNINASNKNEQPKTNNRKRTNADETEVEQKEKKRMKLAERKEEAQKVFEKFIEITNDCNNIKVYSCKLEDCNVSTISLLT